MVLVFVVPMSVLLMFAMRLLPILRRLVVCGGGAPNMCEVIVIVVVVECAPVLPVGSPVAAPKRVVQALTYHGECKRPLGCWHGRQALAVH